MRVAKWELSKEEYTRYTGENGKKLFGKEKVPVQIHCGYGYYGVGFREEEGKYYAMVSMGDSCD